MSIPTKFYLRTNHISPRGMARKIVFTYWNYRNTQGGTCIASDKKQAKKIITKRHPDAEFYR
jgi:uncharacterized sporulation protein YeaH/YhbH (DUF444 family)